ncbi:MAG: hypothetical protein ACRDGR_06685 [bacterium]
MKLRLICAAAVAAIPSIWANAHAGIQVTTCDRDGTPDVYYFFACTPNVQANELVIQLYNEPGTQIVNAATPNVSGFTALVPNTSTAAFGFPAIGPFVCIPDLPGDQNKFRIHLTGNDEMTMVTETWKNQGVLVAYFISVIACPPGPLSMEESSWGRMKSLYR